MPCCHPNRIVQNSLVWPQSFLPFGRLFWLVWFFFSREIESGLILHRSLSLKPRQRSTHDLPVCPLQTNSNAISIRGQTDRSQFVIPRRLWENHEYLFGFVILRWPCVNVDRICFRNIILLRTPTYIGRSGHDRDWISHHHMQFDCVDIRDAPR